MGAGEARPELDRFRRKLYWKLASGNEPPLAGAEGGVRSRPLSVFGRDEAKPKRRRARRPLGFMPLEPRIMYDGAAAASALHHHHDAGDHNGANGPSALAGHIAGAPINQGAGQDGNHWIRDASATNTVASHPTTKVVFIDAQVPDLQDLVNGVKPGEKVFVLNANQDGLQQIAGILASNHLTNLSSISIVGHGQQGEFTIGSTDLTDSNLAAEAQSLAAIGKSLRQGGDILLYGCDTAQGDAGQQFISDFSAYAGGHNVAASTQEIGTLQGSNGTFENWTLDVSTGAVDAKAPFTDTALANYQGLLAGTTVTATGFTTTLTVDADGDGGISPGDTVTSQVTINNTTSTAATGVTLSETLSGLTETGNVTITPIGVNDAYTMVGNTPETFDAAHGVLANDINFNGDTLSVDTVKGATNVVGGLVTLNSDGSFTFTPTTGFSGTASFQYFVKDAAAGDSDQAATATITVTAPVWYVDSAASAAGADGSFAHPFQTVTSAVNAAAGDTSAGVNNTIFVENAGATYNEASVITLKSGEQLLGDGSSLTSVNGHTVGLSSSNPTVSVNSSSAVVTLNSGNTVSGINITNAGSGAGIADSASSTGTTTMSNIAVSTQAGEGIVLTHSGTVDITGTTNTITSSTGTALDVEGATIGSSGITFESISSGSGGNTANAGIILENTGATAGLTVTGDGNASQGGDGSGGTIEDKTGSLNISGTDGVSETTSSTTGTGIFLKNTLDPSFNDMTLQNFTNFAIYGSGVTGFNLGNSTVTATAGFNGGLNGQSDAGGSEEGSIRFDNLFGIAAITGSKISDGYTDNINIQDGENGVTTGTLDLTISGDQLGLVGHNDGILLTAWHSTTFNATVTGNTFLGAAADFFSIAGQDTSTTNVIVSNNTFQFGETPISGGSDPISVLGDQGTWDIVNNIIDSSTTGTTTGTGSQNSYQEQAIFVDATDGGGTVKATVEGNMIGPAFGGNAGQQSNADGIAAQVVFSETLDLLVENNTLTGYSANQGISLLATQGTNTLNATVFGNAESSPNTAFGTNTFGIAVTGAGTGGQVSTINLVVGSATVSGEKNTFVGASGVAIATSNLSSSDVINLSENGGGTTNYKTVLAADNNGSPAATSGGIKNPALVTSLPTTPPAVPTLLTSGFSISGGPTAQEGSTVSASQTATDYQWQEAFSGSGYADIAGANSQSFTPTEAQVGATLRVVETEVNSDGTADSATRAATATVADHLTLTQPLISGADTVGQILTASTPTVSNADATVTYQWQRDGVNITSPSTADGQTYTLTSADAGHTIDVVATATDPHGGNVSQTSGATGTIAGFTTPTSVSSLSIGTLPGNDSITVSWEATVNAQSNQLIVKPTYTGSVTGSNVTNSPVTANATVTLDTLSLEGEIFDDAKADGLLNAGDSAISGVSLSVFTGAPGSGALLESTTTDANGKYDFTGLAQGQYYVEVNSSNFSTGHVLAAYGNSSPVRNTVLSGTVDQNYGLALSNGVIDASQVSISYDQPNPSGPTTYPADDTTAMFDIGLTKNPVISGVGNTAQFYQSGSAVALDGGLSLTDNGSASGGGLNVTSATIAISPGSFLNGDTLNFTNQNGISEQSYTAGVLTLTGSATAAQYQAALESITYSFSGDPTNAGADKTRTVTWSVSDSNSQTSATGTTSTIDVFMTPVLAGTVTPTPTVTATSGAITADANLTVTDHNTIGTTPVATVAITTGAQAGDELSILAADLVGTGITATGNNTNSLTLTGTSATTAAQFQTVLEEVTFNAASPNSGTRVLTWAFEDDSGGNVNNKGAFTTTVAALFGPEVTGGVTINDTEGAPTGAVTLATFTDPALTSPTKGDFTATIDWGDGSATTAGTVTGAAGGPFTVTSAAGHTYAEEGSHTITVSVTDTNNATSSATDTASVGDAPLTAGTVSVGGGVAGVTPATLTATFTDANLGAPTSDFSGTINWGDGTAPTTFASSNVTGAIGSFVVSGSHTYANAGNDNVIVTINDVGGKSTTDTGSTTVSKASPAVATTASSAVTLSTTSVTLADSANLAGGGNPSGTITFTLTGPGGFSYTQTDTATGDGTYAAGVTLPTTGTVTGLYSWHASYSGDTNNNPASDNGINEQTTVSPASPALITTASPTVALSTIAPTLSDSAVLSGAYFPTGSITFTLTGPGGATVDTVTDPVSGDGTYVASDTLPSSGAVAGAYTWHATYASGDGNNNGATDQGGPAEQTIVSPATPTLTTTPSVTAVTLSSATPATLNDSAVLAGGFSPTGTITFTLFENGGPTPVDTETVSVNGDGTYSTPTGFTLPTTGTVAGTYQWNAAYSSGDGNNNGASDIGASNERVTVSPASPTLVTTPSSPTVTLGTTAPTLSDTAVLSGGYNETGAITFTLFENGGPTPVDTETVSVHGDGIYATPTGFTLPSTGTVAGVYQWDATYNGDTNNNGLSDNNAPNERVTVSPASPTLITTPNPSAVTLGTTAPTLSDTADLAGGYNETGSITFTLFENGGPTPVDTETVSVHGDGIYATPTGFTLPSTGTVAGVYQWDATYNGDTNNKTASDSGSPSEQTTVFPASPTVTTTASPTNVALFSNAPVTLSDTATLSGGFNPTGTITFTLTGPGGFSYVQTDAVNGDGAFTGSTSLPIGGAVAGTYSWVASYSGDGNNNGASESGSAPNEQTTVLPEFVVINTNDSGVGSLRQAILDANLGLVNAITFDIPGSGPQIITLASALPAVTAAAVTIDGASQPGYAGSPIVEIDGAGLAADGLDFTAGASGGAVKGLSIVNFGLAGVDLNGASNVTIQGNLLGVDLSGTTAAPNSFGIELQAGADNNTIGGATAGAGNVISGNQSSGIVIDHSDANTVAGNFIGTNTAGTSALANGADGVLITDSSTGNTIGGTTAGAGDVISGNAANGVEIDGSSTNTIVGNLIGSDVTGSTALGNGSDGVLITVGSSDNTIGGTISGARNVVSGNSVNGVEISGGSNTNTISGNLIGSDVTGTVALANGQAGVEITGSDDNTVGGAAAGAGDTIGYNGGAGVSIVSGVGNSVEDDAISHNAIGIDLGVGASLTVSNSTLSDNAATGSGGGIFVGSGATLTVLNSTLSGNSAGVDGGGIFVGNSVTLTVSNSNLSDNAATGFGGGIFVGGGAPSRCSTAPCPATALALTVAVFTATAPSRWSTARSRATALRTMAAVSTATPGVSRWSTPRSRATAP